jgi:hypothetical protein
MGRRSKASLAHINNLSKASLKSYKATVEDAPYSEADDTGYTSGPVNDDTDSNFDIDDTHLDVEDEELNGIRGQFFALEDDVHSDSDLDSVSGDSDLEDRDLDEDEEAEIQNDAALLTFAAMLQQAQETAATAENKKYGGRKRPKRYAGNSSCTLRWHAMKRRKLASEGQCFISKWACNVGTGTAEKPPSNLVSVS